MLRILLCLPVIFSWCFLSAIEGEMKDLIPYMMEETHPAKLALDQLFAQYQPLKSIAHLKKAQFRIVSARSEGMLVLAHPQLPGYLLKLFPWDGKKGKNRNSFWAIERCFYATGIRELIKAKRLRYFAVPMKWIYVLANRERLKAQGIKNSIVLVVEDMQLVSQKARHQAWKSLSSREVLDELYIILQHGYSSCHLPANMPLTIYGKFACIDTEKPHIPACYERVNKYLSKKMQVYWDELIRKHP